MPVVLYLECLKILRLSQPLNGKEHDEELSFVLSFFLRHRHFTLLKATVLRLAFFSSLYHPRVQNDREICYSCYSCDRVYLISYILSGSTIQFLIGI